MRLISMGELARPLTGIKINVSLLDILKNTLVQYSGLEACQILSNCSYMSLINLGFSFLKNTFSFVFG